MKIKKTKSLRIKKLKKLYVIHIHINRYNLVTNIHCTYLQTNSYTNCKVGHQ